MPRIAIVGASPGSQEHGFGDVMGNLADPDGSNITSVTGLIVAGPDFPINAYLSGSPTDPEEDDDTIIGTRTILNIQGVLLVRTVPPVL